MSGAGLARWTSRSFGASDTAAIGEVLGRSAPDGAVILLEGPLGAGKTTLAQGVGMGCGVQEPVTSPTYNLILHYRGRRPFTHVDLYRLADVAALESLDLDEVLEAGGVTCVEWPELLEARRIEGPWARFLLSPVAGCEGERLIEAELSGAGWNAPLAALAGLENRLR